MISSLPKPLQNDFDTVIIDILSRYSLDNKSVQKLVQTVAQQVRDISRVPRILRPAKTSTGRMPTDKDKEADNKPGFTTRLQNLQNTFNKGGLLGVFFEYLKNKQTDAKAKVATPNFTTPEQQEKTETTPSQDIKPVDQKGIKLQTNENIPEQDEQQETNTFNENVITHLEQLQETFDTQLTKLQEAFDSKGLLNVVQSILSVLKRKSSETPNAKDTETSEEEAIATTTTNTTNTDNLTTNTKNIQTPENTINLPNIQGVDENDPENLPNIQGVDENDPEIQQPQAQQENVIADETLVILGGFDEYGKRELVEILNSVLKGIIPKEQVGVSAKAKETPTGEGGGGAGGGLIGLLASLSQMGGLLKGMLPMLARFGSALGVAGTALAGNYIGGQVGKMIGSDETFSEYWYGSKTAGKEAYEKYGTGIEGFTAAAYDYMFGEGAKLREDAKESEKRTEELNKQELERSKQTAKKVAKDPKQVQTAIEKFSKQIQDTQKEIEEKQKAYDAVQEKGFFERESGELDRAKDSLEAAKALQQTLQHRLEDLKKASSESAPPSSDQETKPDVQLKDGGIVTGPTIAQIGEAGPEMVLPLKDFGIQPNNITNNKQLTNFFSNITNASDSSTLLTPETTKINSSVPQSISQTHITNSSVDNKALTDIAGNTEKTNQTLGTLGDAIFRLAKVFDSKTMSGGSNVFVNSNGQSREYTSTAQIAANNVDPIRNIRRQFLAAT